MTNEIIDLTLEKRFGKPPDQLTATEAAEYIEERRKLETRLIRAADWEAVFNEPVSVEQWDDMFQKIMEKFKTEV